MRLILLLLLPYSLFAQPISQTAQSQKINNKQFLLTNNYGSVQLKTWNTNATDTNYIDITNLESTGNPVQHIGFQFVTEQIGFVYGNEMGYGIWPFFIKTVDGGKTWERLLFEKREYGAPIMPEYFHMFDEKRGILIYNYKRGPDSFILNAEKRLRYYITKDGGNTWKSRTKKIKNNVRISNEEHRLSCSYDDDGKVTLKILKTPWEAASGKRSLEDRTILELISNDFGKRFIETLINK